MMSAAIMLDIAMAVLPSLGIFPPLTHHGRRNLVVMAGVLLGFVVWVLFAIALFLYRQHRLEPYHTAILAVEILWFVDVMLFLYGVYR
jgi:lipopolysaccharide export LptBFGC system permease protein LptF